ncbi:phage holin family protein [Acrocarpospora catenulata]|uniref:phage holin family protein n=1 Tax=Acrocarpospora catenulata TaxID=2836182 RepID=UPI0027E1D3CC|nr:phage holin family protein [Acrocarpospora catenulata]
MSGNLKESLSMPELVQQVSDQVSRLVKNEVRLAKTELTHKGQHAKKGAAMFGGAGLMAFFGAATLIACVVLAIALVLPAWAAALIVGVALLVLAGLLAAVGRFHVTQTGPPTPAATMRSIRADIDAVKAGVAQGRNHHD